jgi:hypothetical protein
VRWRTFEADSVTGESIERLRSFLKAYAERQTSAPQPAARTALDAGERQTHASGERLRNVVRPVLSDCMGELRNAGHEASVHDHTDSEDAYPSVALSFTPRARGAGRRTTTLASVLVFRYDPRRGIVVQRDIRASAARGRLVTTSADRSGTIGVDAVSTEWVETKTLNFVEAVLKAN